ncbi:MAG TPA: NAD-dependent epimerase/dehydratase family protein [Candidatus Kryptonia bacterium]
MTVLVTGATGFIGRHLVRTLVERGEKVRALCRPTSDTSELRRIGAAICYGDLLNPESLYAAAHRCKRVYHLAAYARNWSRDKSDFSRMNVDGFANIIRASMRAGVDRVLHTSTIMTIGPSNGSPVIESTVRHGQLLTDYEKSKAEADKVASEYGSSGLELVTVHPTRVFGPGLLTEANSATKLIALYMTGKWRVVPGDGNAIGNYAFVDDVVKGLVLAMENGISGSRYILGGENISYDAFFNLVSEITGRKYFLIHVPATISVAIAYCELTRAKLFNGYPRITPEWAKTFLLDWASSSEKAHHELGYTITPLKQGLEATVDWINHNWTYITANL